MRVGRCMLYFTHPLSPPPTHPPTRDAACQEGERRRRAARRSRYAGACRHQAAGRAQHAQLEPVILLKGAGKASKEQGQADLQV